MTIIRRNENLKKSIHIDWTNEQPNSRDSQQTVTHFRESELRGACVSVTLWSDDLARSPPPSDLNTVSRLFRSYELVINFLSLSAKLIHINLFKGLGCGVLLLVPTAQIRAIHQSHGQSLVFNSISISETCNVFSLCAKTYQQNNRKKHIKKHIATQHEFKNK